MLVSLHTAARHLPAPLRNLLRTAWRHLPPRDRRLLLMDLDDPARRAAFLRSPAYQAFAAREMAHWSAYQEKTDTQTLNERSGTTPAPPTAPPPRFKYFIEHPLVFREIQHRAAPETSDPWRWLADRFPGRRHALALGAGAGDHCRILVDLAIASRVTAFDIAEGSVRRARAEFARLGYPIDYQVADLNFAAFEPGRYDLCLGMYSLHHLIELEGLVRNVARALEPGCGVLVCEDYFGPRWVELPRAAARVVNALFQKLPARLRRAHDGTVFRRLPLRDRWEIARESPFEAIRSDRLLDLIRASFQIEVFNPLGCGVLSTVLAPILHNFDPADEEANQILHWLLQEDGELTRQGLVPNHFAFLTATPRRIPS